MPNSVLIQIENGVVGSFFFKTIKLKNTYSSHNTLVKTLTTKLPTIIKTKIKKKIKTKIKTKTKNEYQYHYFTTINQKQN